MVRFASLLLCIESVLWYWHVCLAFAQEELEEVMVIKVCLLKGTAREQGSYADLVNADETAGVGSIWAYYIPRRYWGGART